MPSPKVIGVPVLKMVPSARCRRGLWCSFVASGMWRFFVATLTGALCTLLFSAMGWRAYHEQVVTGNASQISIAVYLKRAENVQGRLTVPVVAKLWAWYTVRMRTFDWCCALREDYHEGWGPTAPLTPAMSAVWLAPLLAMEEAEPPPWSGLNARGVMSRADAANIQAFSVGWPFRSWRAVGYQTPISDRVGVVRAVEGTDLQSVRLESISDSAFAWNFPGRIIPTHPLWPGLIGNVVFFGLIAWAVLLMPIGLRAGRARRAIRLGRCTHCRYTFGTQAAICPECGRPRARNIGEHLAVVYRNRRSP